MCLHLNLLSEYLIHWCDAFGCTKSSNLRRFTCFHKNWYAFVTFRTTKWKLESLWCSLDMILPDSQMSQFLLQSLSNTNGFVFTDINSTKNMENLLSNGKNTKWKKWVKEIEYSYIRVYYVFPKCVCVLDRRKTFFSVSRIFHLKNGVATLRRWGKKNTLLSSAEIWRTFFHKIWQKFTINMSHVPLWLNCE